MELLVKTAFDVRSCFETSLPAAFPLYIATKMLQEWKGFQAHLNQIQDQSWPDILDFTLLRFMWFNKNTGQLSQLHSRVHVTVNVSTHCTCPPSFFHFSISTNNSHCSPVETALLDSCGWNCSFFSFVMVWNVVHAYPLDTGDTYYLLLSLLTAVSTLQKQLSQWRSQRRHKHLLSFGTRSLCLWLLLCTH